jgi:mannan endo-1,4-beta-mannosidase
VNQLGQYIDEGGASMPEIAKTGANAVRIFWYVTRGRGVAGMEPAIEAALANQMVPVIEAHDSTCTWAMDGIESAWLAPDAVALIKKFEGQLIVNIANEANAPDLGTFTSTYSRIIRSMRDAGIRVPLMIDAASRCGRDWQSLLNQGRALLDADPDRNLIFSAHLYDPMSAEGYAAAFRQFNDLGLAFVVGEFANREPPGCGAAIDYKALIAEAQKAGIGWFAWSWGDNNPGTDWNGDCGEFDMTDTFSDSTLRGWGLEVMVTDPNSAKITSARPYSLHNGGMCRP